MKVIGMVPARAGSTRVKDKCIRNMNGTPLIKRTTDVAYESKYLDKVFVYTDYDPIEISGLVYNSNIGVVERPSKSDNYKTVQEECIDFLDNIDADVIVMMLVTTPLRTVNTLRDSIYTFLDKELDFLVTSSEYIQNPFWAHLRGKGFIFEDKIKERSQDLPKLTCPNGSIWIANVKMLKETKTFYTPDTYVHEIPFIEGIDIDTEDDWNFAETILKGMEL